MKIMRVCPISSISIVTSAVLAAHTAASAGQVTDGKANAHSDGRPAAHMRMEAKDQGVILKHGDGPGECDIHGAREALIFKEKDIYHLFYDGAGPPGWRACLAISKDLKIWEKKGPVLQLGAAGEDDSAAACSPWVHFDGKEWHMFYLGTPNASPPPDRIPSFPYLTLKAKSKFLAGPWVKQPDVVPFRPQPGTYYSLTASPGDMVRYDDGFLQFFSSTVSKPGNPFVQRTLGIARTMDLNGAWTIDDKPMVPIEEQIENSSIYYEKAHKTWFLFTNHIGLEEGEYTDAIWVYWTKDLNKWDSADKAVVLDGNNCSWSKKCIGMPSVIEVGNRLAVFYDAPGGDSKSHMKRDIGLAWLDLPLTLPKTDGSESVIPVTDSALLRGLSPYNWVCQEDSINASVAGASMTLGFKGTRNVALKVDTSHLEKLTPARCPVLAWTVNGGDVQSHQLKAGETTIPLARGVANPVIDLFIKGMSPFEDRWNGDAPANSVRITGFDVDAGATSVPVKMPEKIWLNIGDSIMSGDAAAYATSQGRPPDDGWAAASHGRASYGFLLARHFGYREARIAYGGYNWAGGMAGLPALPRLIDQKTSTVSRLNDGLLRPPPDVVLLNLGENGVPKDADVIEFLTQLRSRIGKAAAMLVMLPVSGKGTVEISRAFASYQSASKDGNSTLINLGKIQFETADGQHPTAAGHQRIFEAARPVCGKILTAGGEATDPADTALGAPFWNSKIMRDEPVLFIQEEGKTVAAGRLLFKPGGKLKITSPDLKTVYENGRDYLWKPGSETIELKSGSRIPFKTAAEMLPPPGSPNTYGGVLHSEGRYFHDLQVKVTYQHAGKWNWQPPAPQKRLAKTLAKLKARQPVKIVALGDSITEGYNASGFVKVNAPPYQPAFPGLVANTLRQRFGSPVALVNLGLGGKRAEWGMGEVAKVAAEKPDLVILAFGMNHSEAAPAFGETMSKLLAAVQADSPAADVVLVAPMAGNPRIFPPERFTSYRDALAKLQSPTVALADVTTPWLELVKRKPFADLSGNHVNHPNDFSHRLYAQVICHLFSPN